jgi:S1-C subfamily serine protease
MLASEGIVSQTGFAMHSINTIADPSVAPGSSGGPVTNQYGEFVGMVLSMDITSGNFIEVLAFWRIEALLVPPKQAQPIKTIY